MSRAVNDPGAPAANPTESIVLTGGWRATRCPYPRLKTEES